MMTKHHANSPKRGKNPLNTFLLFEADIPEIGKKSKKNSRRRYYLINKYTLDSYSVLCSHVAYSDTRTTSSLVIIRENNCPIPSGLTRRKASEAARIFLDSTYQSYMYTYVPMAQNKNVLLEALGSLYLEWVMQSIK